MGFGAFIVILLAVVAVASSLLGGKTDPIETMSGTTYSAKEVAIAQAIAKAEGYGVAGAIPTVRNNPGDIGNDPVSGIHTFDNPQDGWNALYHQVHLMTTGQSRYYNPSMTWTEIGKTYADDPSGTWAGNVAAALGVDPDSTLEDYLNG